MTTAFIFPGQGSQSVGMGKALAADFPQAAAVFAEVDDALSQKLSHLMFEGPEGDLTLTANAQPALMAVSIAVLRVLEAEAGLDLAKDAKFVAGHSLGEYSALAAAGSFTLADTARLLRLRGQAMQKAVPVGEVKAPKAPLVANVTASALTDPAEIRRRLVEQVTGTVRWRECMAYMAAQGVTTFYEVGAGKVLSGLVKRIADTATGISTGTPADVATFKSARQG